MQHFKIKVSIEEACKMGDELPYTILFSVRDTFRAILQYRSLSEGDWVERAYALAILWNAGRVQGIREERARRRCARTP